MSDNQHKFEENVLERFKLASENNSFTFTDELNILNYLHEKYKFKTISGYAKDSNISYQGSLKRVASKKIMTMKIGGILFIFGE